MDSLSTIPVVNLVSAITASIASPTQIRRQSLANLFIRFFVYSLDNVPGVASNPIILFFESFAAGLTAGTTPTIGMLITERREGKATVLAVLHAITIALKLNSELIC